MRIIMLALAAVMLTGCAGNWPQNPQELRNWATRSPHKNELVDTIVVARPFATVATTMHKQSTACLTTTVGLKIASPNMYSNGIPAGGESVHDAGTATYKVNFHRHGNHAEATVQRALDSSNYIEAGGVPKGGAYRVVADVEALSARRTKVVVYRMFLNDHADEAIRDAFLHWAKGDNLGCPVLAD